jgi:hypothetical protein
VPTKLTDCSLADLDGLLGATVNAAHAELAPIPEAGTLCFYLNIMGRADADTVTAADAMIINPETLPQPSL